jgi:outer membrane protein assembly factor BamB
MAAVSITPVPASEGGSVDPAATATPSGLPSTGPASAAPIGHGVFAGDLLIADRGNNRILIVNSRAQVLWKFPVAGSLSTAQTFSADDAFLAPDGRTILASEELHQIVVRIDIATKRITWQYGHYGQARAAVGYLNTPDDAYPWPTAT